VAGGPRVEDGGRVYGGGVGRELPSGASRRGESIR